MATQLDLSEHPSTDPLYGEQIIVTAERNIIVGLVATSSKEGKIKTQEWNHKKPRVRIEVSLEDVIQYKEMSYQDAAKKLVKSIPWKFQN